MHKALYRAYRPQTFKMYKNILKPKKSDRKW